jgi:hypothetical protein
MNRIISKYSDKLFFKKWIIGICLDNIYDIIRSKIFDPKINWLLTKSFDKFYADPFFVTSADGNFNILFEEFPFDDDYGKISLLKLDKNLKQINHKVLLDTKSHLSYPFVFQENNKTYIFPEAAKSGKLSCYEFDTVNESLSFLQDVLNLPLRDSTILKHDDKYWLFGILSDEGKDYKLLVFYSDSLLGPYIPHPCNPVNSGLDGTRSAGNFIVIDGVIYRPTQNCRKGYGESITINKVTQLNEISVVETPYMTISINKKNRHNNGIHSIHTINMNDNIIVVDGEHWTFSPILQFKKFIRSILELQRLKKQKTK